MQAASGELFETIPEPREEPLGEGALVLRAFALAHERELLDALDGVIRAAPWRHMMTPGGLRMSVAMSNCGALGWISDRRGYRYAPDDPQSGRSWPPMPDVFAALARDAAAEAGFEHFAPDACLINRYEPGAKLSLHQDRDERDFGEPIVSVSLGLPATFLFGGLRRTDKQIRIPLVHGDVVAWGGTSRMRYHGVLPLKDGTHPLLGACRINLTFRKAG
ncbi:MAG TPA: DNA oxidative demethylase AlkB [Rhodanobacteraceae bacterium]|nr:DNA oxidative demethylase AlkB [Rhodanobacteraceae bacterium]